MDIAITRMSSKGQIVIPAEMRKDFQEGDKLLLIQTDGQLIMKKASKLDVVLKEDLEFAKRTEEAWKRIEEGKGIKMDFDDFIQEMKKW
ncbi:MAG: AbrB/MazE/SpoVT family DNA-binding domain-containing protein [Nanoarchaeota archaeon]|nr:AbrB/MazE/SpoVT family DNA-binding domain-containing protein [Nanoarchaeota archaeon]MBU1270106.1 AbrB/MazE/SpoVT family DNA-binding domain-containing protein [Nanoarchaeota archaeon]MBU1604547.1 AbrB/MazE/SpoVT family DNA-binding domain-containing protein [Nanoarchaeota archaeon]MBU2459190.1 AbrB/MazE/SpoVT family DNA-binding domain-containing protein [Nanoarchaeota archaeon]